MSTIHVTATEVKRAHDPLAEASAKVDDLVTRMKLALDAIAEAAGAWHCESCGEWTTEAITVESHSDEMGVEIDERCARCV